MPFSIEPMNSRASGSAAPVAAGALDEALDREEAEDGGEDFELATRLRMTLMENKYRSLALRDTVPNGLKASRQAGAIQRQQRAARQFFSSRHSCAMGIYGDVGCPSCWASPMRMPSGPRI
jgi:hypothetical protein